MVRIYPKNFTFITLILVYINIRLKLKPTMISYENYNVNLVLMQQRIERWLSVNTKVPVEIDVV